MTLGYYKKGYPIAIYRALLDIILRYIIIKMMRIYDICFIRPRNGSFKDALTLQNKVAIRQKIIIILEGVNMLIKIQIY